MIFAKKLPRATGQSCKLCTSKPVHQLIVLKPRIALKQGGQRLASVSGDLALNELRATYTYM